MRTQPIDWLQLHGDKDLRHRHYFQLTMQVLNIDLFIKQMRKAFHTRQPCSIYFDLSGDMVALSVWAIPEIPDTGDAVLEWVSLWAVNRRNQVQERMREMSNRWPYLEAMVAKMAQDVVMEPMTLKVARIGPRPSGKG